MGMGGAIMTAGPFIVFCHGMIWVSVIGRFFVTRCFVLGSGVMTRAVLEALFLRLFIPSFIYLSVIFVKAHLLLIYETKKTRCSDRVSKNTTAAVIPPLLERKRIRCRLPALASDLGEAAVK